MVVADAQQALRTNGNAGAATRAHILIENPALKIEKWHVARYSVVTSGVRGLRSARPLEQDFMLPPQYSIFEHNGLADAIFSLSALSRLCQHFSGLATLGLDLYD